MADGLNRVLLIGNLGQDPELRYTQGGQAILNLRIATSESYLNRDGERQERTEWHSVTVWGKRGEALGKILSKGRQIFVEGRMQTRSWEDKQGGGKRYATEVVATDVILLGGAGRGTGPRTNYDEATAPRGDDGDPQQQDNRRGGSPSGGVAAGGEVQEDDDIPF